MATLRTRKTGSAALENAKNIASGIMGLGQGIVSGLELRGKRADARAAAQADQNYKSQMLALQQEELDIKRGELGAKREEREALQTSQAQTAQNMMEVVNANKAIPENDKKAIEALLLSGNQKDREKGYQVVTNLVNAGANFMWKDGKTKITSRWEQANDNWNRATLSGDPVAIKEAEQQLKIAEDGWNRFSKMQDKYDRDTKTPNVFMEVLAKYRKSPNSLTGPERNLARAYLSRNENLSLDVGVTGVARGLIPSLKEMNKLKTAMLQDLDRLDAEAKTRGDVMMPGTPDEATNQAPIAVDEFTGSLLNGSNEFDE
jgi:hypothetical protein